MIDHSNSEFIPTKNPEKEGVKSPSSPDFDRFLYLDILHLLKGERGRWISRTKVALFIKRSYGLVNHHLKLLEASGLIEMKQDRKKVYYRIKSLVKPRNSVK